MLLGSGGWVVLVMFVKKDISMSKINFNLEKFEELRKTEPAKPFEPDTYVWHIEDYGAVSMAWIRTNPDNEVYPLYCEVARDAFTLGGKYVSEADYRQLFHIEEGNEILGLTDSKTEQEPEWVEFDPETYKTDFKVGDKVKCLFKGDGIVKSINFKEVYPIMIMFGDVQYHYTKDGRLYTDAKITLFPAEYEPKVFIRNPKSTIRKQIAELEKQLENLKSKLK